MIVVVVVVVVVVSGGGSSSRSNEKKCKWLCKHYKIYKYKETVLLWPFAVLFFRNSKCMSLLAKTAETQIMQFLVSAMTI